MNALVTGITGFAGSHLAEHLLDRGHRVVGIARGGAALPKSFGKIELLKWDVTQPLPDGLFQRLEAARLDWVFHLAALSVPADCGDRDPTAAAWQTNVEGAGHVLQLVSRLTRTPRLVYVSSCAVYAPVEAANPVVNERAAVGPTSGYGKTKAEVERRLSASSLDYVVARAFQHTGPRQVPRMMLPEWSRQFAQGGNRPIRVMTLDSHLDLTDVRDVVRAYLMLAEKGESRSVYNVGSGRSVRSGDVFEILRSLYDRSRTALETAPGPKHHPIADTSRLVKCCGWRPEIPLEATVRDTLDFWQQESI